MADKERWQIVARGNADRGNGPVSVVVEEPLTPDPRAWSRLQVSASQYVGAPTAQRLVADGTWAQVDALSEVPDDLRLGLPVPPGFLEAVRRFRSTEVDALVAKVDQLEGRLADAQTIASEYRVLADTAARTVDGLRTLLQVGEVAADLDKRVTLGVVPGGD